MQKFLQVIKDILEWLIQALSAVLATQQGQPPQSPNDIPIPTRLPREKPTKTDDATEESSETDSEETPSEETEEEPEPRPRRSRRGGIEIDPDYGKRRGFNRRFLSIALPFPQLAPLWASSVVEFEEFNNSKQVELKYHHFSVVMNIQRKMPFFTAVNIDGESYEALKEEVPTRREIGVDKWFFDPRIAKTQQLGADFYKGNDFDIGHMVRREDALWGETLEEAIKANNDTFHLTNACPQHKDFNRNAKRWLGLENYALQNARKYGLKISVYTGPIFRRNDLIYNGIRIPASFWKVIVMIKDNGSPSATGYLVQQKDLIEDMDKQEFVYSQFLTYQVPIAEIERLTNISFFLNNYDPLQKSNRRNLTFQPEPIDDYEMIEF